MGKGARAARRVGNADFGQKLDDAPAALGAIEAKVGLQRFADLKADGEARIERRHRLLEDHRHVLAGQPAPLVGRHRHEIGAVERHAVGGDGRGRRQKAHRRQHRHRLARTGFADDRQHFVALEGEVEAVHRLERSVPGGEGDGEIADVEQMRRHQPSPHLGIERVAQAVAGQIDREDGDEDGQAGKSDDPGIGADEFARVGQHRAPFRGRRLGAETQEAEPRRLENGARHAKRGLHDEGGEAIGQYRRIGKPERPDAGHARRGHVVLAEFAERRSARQPHVLWQVDDCHRYDGVGEARPQNRDDENGKHQARHGQNQIHQPRYGDVERSDRPWRRRGRA